MRSHNGEHGDTLPVLDIASLRHIAYVLDALIYYMRSGTDIDSDIIRDTGSVQSWVDNDDTIHDDADDDAVNQSVAMETDSMDGESEVGGAGKGTGRKHPFFQRTDSTTFLGCVPPDPFQVPLEDAIPMAERPQLLQPNARKEELFGVPKHTIPLTDMAVHATADKSPFLPTPTPFDRLPTHLALSTRAAAGLTSQSGYGVGMTATEVPLCSVSQGAPPVETGSQNAAPTNTTVIVRPSGQVVASTVDGASRATVVNSDLDVVMTSAVPSGGGSVGEPAARAGACPGTTAPPTQAATRGSTESAAHEVEVEKQCTQASVIVHASTAQSMALHPGGTMKPATATEGAKIEEAREEAREQGPCTAPTATPAARYAAVWECCTQGMPLLCGTAAYHWLLLSYMHFWPVSVPTIMVPLCDHDIPCSTLYDYDIPCSTLCDHDIPCSTLCDHDIPCSTLCDHDIPVVHYVIMTSHVVHYAIMTSPVVHYVIMTSPVVY